MLKTSSSYLSTSFFLQGLVLPAVHQQEPCPTVDHSSPQTPHLNIPARSAGQGWWFVPQSGMPWDWTAAWLRIWNNLQVKHWGHVSVCPTWASPVTFFSPSFDSSRGEGMAGWGQASGTTAFTSHLFTNLLFQICLSQTVMEGQRKVEVLCPDKRVD